MKSGNCTSNNWVKKDIFENLSKNPTSKCLWPHFAQPDLFCSNPLPNGVIIMYLTCIFVCARYGTLSKVIYAHAAYIHSTHIHGSVTV